MLAATDDPVYLRSTLRNYPDLDSALQLRLDRLSPEAIDSAVAGLLRLHVNRMPAGMAK